MSIPTEFGESMAKRPIVSTYSQYIHNPLTDEDRRFGETMDYTATHEGPRRNHFLNPFDPGDPNNLSYFVYAYSKEIGFSATSYYVLRMSLNNNPAQLLLSPFLRLCSDFL
jgi:hypothetical protein